MGNSTAPEEAEEQVMLPDVELFWDRLMQRLEDLGWSHQDLADRMNENPHPHDPDPGVQWDSEGVYPTECPEEWKARGVTRWVLELYAGVLDVSENWLIGEKDPRRREAVLATRRKYE